MIDCPEFLSTEVTTANDKSQFVTLLKKFLKPIPPFSNNQIEFWDWLSNKCSVEQAEEIRLKLLQRLPKANGYVATFNPILTFCTGSHNNTSLLGGMGQAKSAMFYLIPHQGKNKFPIMQTLTVLNKALEHIQKYKSTSQHDAGTLRPTEHGEVWVTDAVLKPLVLFAHMLRWSRPMKTT